jgi:single-strand DNA-binding protein
MAGFNRIILLGGLTRDPEMRVTPKGTQVTSFRLAASRKYRLNEELKEETLFIDVNVFGRQAQNCHQYLKRGSQVLVEGRLTMSEWEAEGGVKKVTYRVTAESVQFLTGKSGDAQPPRSPAPADFAADTPPTDDEPYGDEVPF